MPNSWKSWSRGARVLYVSALVCALFSLALERLYSMDVGLVRHAARVEVASEASSPGEQWERTLRYTHRYIETAHPAELPWLVRQYYRLSPLHPGPGDVLRWGADYRGGTRSQVRVAVAMLQALGIPSRPLLHLGKSGEIRHALVEAYIGGRWVVGDPLYGVAFRRADGFFASAQDLRRDPGTFRSQVEGLPAYDMLRYEFGRVSHFEWNRTLYVLPGFPDFAARALGEDTVEGITRAGLWIWPKEQMSLLLLGLALALGIASWQTHARHRSMGDPVRPRRI